MPYITDNPRPIELPKLLNMIREFDNFSIEKKYQIIDEITSHYGVLNFNLEANAFFFRSRQLRRNKPKFFQDILWPLSKDIPTNRFGNNMFYLSSSMHTSFAEIGSEEGKKVALSVFQLKQDAGVRMLPIGETAQIVKNVRGYFLPMKNQQDIVKIINASLATNEDLTISYIIQDFFLFNQLLSYDHDISNYTLNAILNKLKFDVDIIGYPSLKVKGGYNFCVKQEIFHQKFQIALANIMQVHNIYDNYYKTYTKATLHKIQQDDKLIWKENEEGLDNLFVPLTDRAKVFANNQF